MQYELIVFDWDGTLMDSSQQIIACVQQAAVDLGLDVPGDQAVSHIIGLGLSEAINALFPGSDTNFIQQFSKRYREHFFGNKMIASALFKGAEKVVEQLSDQYLLAVATGKGRQGLDLALDQTGLGRYFHTTRCADETRSKPHPQMLEDIMRDMGMDAADTLMIGDTTFDMDMAVAAGVQPLGVSYGVHDEQKLRECGAIDCLDAITELPKWLC